MTDKPIVFNSDYNKDAPLKAWGYQQMINNGFIYQPAAIKIMKIKGYVDGVIDYSVVYQKWAELGITEDDLTYGLKDLYIVEVMNKCIEHTINDLRWN